jgi:hypothetical protein
MSSLPDHGRQRRSRIEPDRKTVGEAPAIVVACKHLRRLLAGGRHEEVRPMVNELLVPTAPALLDVGTLA